MVNVFYYLCENFHEMARIDEEMKNTFLNEKHRMLGNIIFTANWIQNRFGGFLKPFGISPQQFNVLRILRGAKDWLNMNEVKSRMVEKSPNTTRLCDKLVEKKLIERSRSEADRRVVFLKITNKGLELLEAIDDKDDSSFTGFMENFTDEEAKVVSTILDKLRG